jgi:hypothetical protein
VRGRYLVGAAVEDFTLVEGRYVTDGLVLELATGRFEAVYDGWVLRGGVVGAEALWVRGEADHRAQATAFTGLSPAFDVAVARRLALEPGQSRRVSLVQLTEPVGAARTVGRTWTRAASEEPDVERFDVADADTGERWVLHVAGDVLVSREGPGAAHLVSLDMNV